MILLTMFNNDQSRIAQVILSGLDMSGDKLQTSLIDEEIEDNPMEPELLVEQGENKCVYKGLGKIIWGLYILSHKTLTESDLVQVYNLGFTSGYASGYNNGYIEGIAEGKETEEVEEIH